MATTIAADQVSYEDLYARWEQGNWRATEIDFSTDRQQWDETFTDLERRGALWTYSMFFHGEDSVTDNLSPYIDAAPRQDQKYFLATQQVDEARHAVLFARFMKEVVDVGFTWDRPYHVDASKFTRRFGFTATPFEIGVPMAVRSFRPARGPASPAVAGAVGVA